MSASSVHFLSLRLSLLLHCNYLYAVHLSLTCLAVSPLAFEPRPSSFWGFVASQSGPAEPTIRAETKNAAKRC